MQSPKIFALLVHMHARVYTRQACQAQTQTNN